MNLPPVIPVQPRPRRNAEVYALTCWSCQRSIEVPCKRVVDDQTTCPLCASALIIQWGVR